MTLVAVTKYASVDAAVALLAAGIGDLGENYAQQLRDRAQDPRFAGARWHAIGPLQANKAGYVAHWATAFHALDRPSIAERLGRLRGEHTPLECYVQVNVAGEPSKAGVAPVEVAGLVQACASVAGISVVGLMTMPPADDAERNRRWFRMLRALAHDVGLTKLSMGTSADFEVAVEEGATAVRIGRGLFD